MCVHEKWDVIGIYKGWLASELITVGSSKQVVRGYAYELCRMELPRRYKAEGKRHLPHNIRPDKFNAICPSRIRPIRCEGC